MYPAGFVYIYTIFYYLTNHGQNIRLAQYCFVGIYLLQVYLVLKIYAKVRKVPPYVLLITTFTSYRIHSIYVLRLFNDPIAILLLYAAINCYLSGKWSWGSVFLSLGVSVKMNVLLFAPAILLLFLVNLDYLNTVKQLSICAIVQLVLGAPFLLTYPIEYLKGSFDLGRVFDHKWTVNYRFLPIEIFEHRYFHLALLGLHLLLLLAFILPTYDYFKSYRELRWLQTQFEQQVDADKRALVANETQQNGTADSKSTLKKRKKKKGTDDKEATANTENNQSQSLIRRYVIKSFETMLGKACGLATGDGMIEPLEKSDYGEYFDRTVQLAVLPIFLANFIGIVCARSLHYQFYVWYFHSLPYLIWYTEFQLSLKFLLLGVIEMAWNTYPSTNVSSAMLHISHLVLLFGIGRKFFRTVLDGRRHADEISANKQTDT